ncbi:MULTISPECIES: hypothetical protein [Chitinophaga]|uniref:hypothetical protein n=1 Tax=Chitinophaga TaxID=79328 RepID=UPI001455B186|nr:MULTISPECIES: hypothetical protein [Chitinophaga]NLU94059.1 hypothetical protein [Chitinophaga sp. Ak27]
MKIGRLGVSNQVQKGGVIKEIIDWIIGLAVKYNDECACEPITVEAYANHVLVSSILHSDFFN